MVDSEIKHINSKKCKAKLLWVLNLFLAIGLTMLGANSITSLLMYLHDELEFNFFACLTMALILPSIYSAIVNVFLKRIDKKVDSILLEVDKLMEEKYDSIKTRFNCLSKDNQLKLLNFVKDKLPEVNASEPTVCLNVKDLMVLEQVIDDVELSDLGIENKPGYSRKRTISEEFHGKK